MRPASLPVGSPAVARRCWERGWRQPSGAPGRAGGLRGPDAAVMVFYFTSNVVPSVYTIYMGKDKYENEDLIKYGWPEDIWFHVDKLSSAHVYLRLHKGQTVDDIPKEVLIDCAHLVKANSIQGCKMNNVNVVYTPWTNLKKTADMDVGQIGFHRQKDVKMLTVEKKVNEILNRLEKTKVERFPDLAAEKEARDREERNEKKAQIQEMKRKEKEEMKKKKELEELRSYSSLMKAENMSSNQDVAALLCFRRRSCCLCVVRLESLPLVLCVLSSPT
uniref:Coiled-coil domain-containing protein 25 n=2 Tax=Aves TaxID=8782 RepID=A0A8B9SEC0_APTOW